MKARVSLFLVCLYFLSAPFMAYADGEGPYVVREFSYKNNTKFIVVKYHKHTGKSWIYSKKGFKEIPEEKKIPESTYQIEFTPVLEGWHATRIDTHTGKTWTVDNGVWKEY